MENLFKEAHKLTKEIKKEYPEVDYKAQFGICLSYLKEEGENRMVELKGSEKQIKWAESIRKEMVEGINFLDMFVDFYSDVKNLKCKEIIKQLLEFKKDILTQDNSKWFIDNRGKKCLCHSCKYMGIKIQVTAVVEEDYEKLASKMEYKFSNY